MWVLVLQHIYIYIYLGTPYTSHNTSLDSQHLVYVLVPHDHVCGGTLFILCSSDHVCIGISYNIILCRYWHFIRQIICVLALQRGGRPGKESRLPHRPRGETGHTRVQWDGRSAQMYCQGDPAGRATVPYVSHKSFQFPQKETYINHKQQQFLRKLHLPNKQSIMALQIWNKSRLLKVNFIYWVCLVKPY